MNQQQMMGMMQQKGGMGGMGGMGMIPPKMMAQKGMMPQMGQKGMPGPGQMPQGGQQPPQPQAQGGAGAPLNAAALAAANPSVQKQMIGEKLYPAIARFQPELAGKITGMMLEMDNSELLILLESEQQLKVKVDEAMVVLQTNK